MTTIFLSCLVFHILGFHEMLEMYFNECLEYGELLFIEFVCEKQYTELKC